VYVLALKSVIVVESTSVNQGDIALTVSGDDFLLAASNLLGEICEGRPYLIHRDDVVAVKSHISIH
jgi:hypothetical protein